MSFFICAGYKFSTAVTEEEILKILQMVSYEHQVIFRQLE